MATTSGGPDGPIHPDFLRGLARWRAGDYQGAAVCFRKAEGVADRRHRQRHRYASFHGLALVHLGDPGGLALCRGAAAADELDVVLLRNLTLAELRAGHRRRALAALQRGLAVDPREPELLRLRCSLGTRRRPVLGFLGRDHPLNRLLGRVTYRRRAG